MSRNSKQSKQPTATPVRPSQHISATSSQRPLRPSTTASAASTPRPVMKSQSVATASRAPSMSSSAVTSLPPTPRTRASAGISGSLAAPATPRGMRSGASSAQPPSQPSPPSSTVSSFPSTTPDPRMAQFLGILAKHTNFHKYTMAPFTPPSAAAAGHAAGSGYSAPVEVTPLTLSLTPPTPTSALTMLDSVFRTPSNSTSSPSTSSSSQLFPLANIVAVYAGAYSVLLLPDGTLHVEHAPDPDTFSSSLSAAQLAKATAIGGYVWVRQCLHAQPHSSPTQRRRHVANDATATGTGTAILGATAEDEWVTVIVNKGKHGIPSISCYDLRVQAPKQPKTPQNGAVLVPPGSPARASDTRALSGSGDAVKASDIRMLWAGSLGRVLGERHRAGVHVPAAVCEIKKNDRGARQAPVIEEKDATSMTAGDESIHVAVSAMATTDTDINSDTAPFGPVTSVVSPDDKMTPVNSVNTPLTAPTTGGKLASLRARLGKVGLDKKKNPENSESSEKSSFSLTPIPEAVAPMSTSPSSLNTATAVADSSNTDIRNLASESSPEASLPVSQPQLSVVISASSSPTSSTASMASHTQHIERSPMTTAPANSTDASTTIASASGPASGFAATPVTGPKADTAACKPSRKSELMSRLQKFRATQNSGLGVPGTGIDVSASDSLLTARENTVNHTIADSMVTARGPTHATGVNTGMGTSIGIGNDTTMLTARGDSIVDAADTSTDSATPLIAAHTRNTHTAAVGTAGAGSAPTAAVIASLAASIGHNHTFTASPTPAPAFKRSSSHAHTPAPASPPQSSRVVTSQATPARTHNLSLPLTPTPTLPLSAFLSHTPSRLPTNANNTVDTSTTSVNEAAATAAADPVFTNVTTSAATISPAQAVAVSGNGSARRSVSQSLLQRSATLRRAENTSRNDVTNTTIHSVDAGAVAASGVGAQGGTSGSDSEAAIALSYTGVTNNAVLSVATTPVPVEDENAVECVLEPAVTRGYPYPAMDYAAWVSSAAWEWEKLEEVMGKCGEHGANGEAENERGYRSTKVMNALLAYLGFDGSLSHEDKSSTPDDKTDQPWSWTEAARNSIFVAPGTSSTSAPDSVGSAVAAVSDVSDPVAPVVCLPLQSWLYGVPDDVLSHTDASAHSSHSLLNTPLSSLPPHTALRTRVRSGKLATLASTALAALSGNPRVHEGLSVDATVRAYAVQRPTLAKGAQSLSSESSLGSPEVSFKDSLVILPSDSGSITSFPSASHSCSSSSPHMSPASLCVAPLHARTRVYLSRGLMHPSATSTCALHTLNAEANCHTPASDNTADPAATADAGTADAGDNDVVTEVVNTTPAMALLRDSWMRLGHDTHVHGETHTHSNSHVHDDGMATSVSASGEAVPLLCLDLTTFPAHTLPDAPHVPSSLYSESTLDSESVIQPENNTSGTTIYPTFPVDLRTVSALYVGTLPPHLQYPAFSCHVSATSTLSLLCTSASSLPYVVSLSFESYTHLARVLTAVTAVITSHWHHTHTHLLALDSCTQAVASDPPVSVSADAYAVLRAHQYHGLGLGHLSNTLLPSTFPATSTHACPSLPGLLPHLSASLRSSFDLSLPLPSSPIQACPVLLFVAHTHFSVARTGTYMHSPFPLDHLLHTLDTLDTTYTPDHATQHSQTSPAPSGSSTFTSASSTSAAAPLPLSVVSLSGSLLSPIVTNVFTQRGLVLHHTLTTAMARALRVAAWSKHTPYAHSSDAHAASFTADGATASADAEAIDQALCQRVGAAGGLFLPSQVPSLTHLFVPALAALGQVQDAQKHNGMVAPASVTAVAQPLLTALRLWLLKGLRVHAFVPQEALQKIEIPDPENTASGIPASVEGHIRELVSHAHPISATAASASSCVSAASVAALATDPSLSLAELADVLLRRHAARNTHARTANAGHGEADASGVAVDVDMNAGGVNGPVAPVSDGCCVWEELLLASDVIATTHTTTTNMDASTVTTGSRHKQQRSKKTAGAESAVTTTTTTAITTTACASVRTITHNGVTIVAASTPSAAASPSSSAQSSSLVASIPVLSVAAHMDVFYHPTIYHAHAHAHTHLPTCPLFAHLPPPPSFPSNNTTHNTPANTTDHVSPARARTSKLPRARMPTSASSIPAASPLPPPFGPPAPLPPPPCTPAFEDFEPTNLPSRAKSAKTADGTRKRVFKARKDLSAFRDPETFLKGATPGDREIPKSERFSGGFSYDVATSSEPEVATSSHDHANSNMYTNTSTSTSSNASSSAASLISSLTEEQIASYEHYYQLSWEQLNQYSAYLDAKRAQNHPITAEEDATMVHLRVQYQQYADAIDRIRSFKAQRVGAVVAGGGVGSIAAQAALLARKREERREREEKARVEREKEEEREYLRVRERLALHTSDTTTHSAVDTVAAASATVSAMPTVASTDATPGPVPVATTTSSPATSIASPASNSVSTSVSASATSPTKRATVKFHPSTVTATSPSQNTNTNTAAVVASPPVTSTSTSVSTSASGSPRPVRPAAASPRAGYSPSSYVTAARRSTHTPTAAAPVNAAATTINANTTPTTTTTAAAADTCSPPPQTSSALTPSSIRSVSPQAASSPSASPSLVSSLDVHSSFGDVSLDSLLGDADRDADEHVQAPRAGTPHADAGKAKSADVASLLEVDISAILPQTQTHTQTHTPAPVQPRVKKEALEESQAQSAQTPLSLVPATSVNTPEQGTVTAAAAAAVGPSMGIVEVAEEKEEMKGNNEEQEEEEEDAFDCDALMFASFSVAATPASKKRRTHGPVRSQGTAAQTTTSGNTSTGFAHTATTAAAAPVPTAPAFSDYMSWYTHTAMPAVADAYARAHATDTSTTCTCATVASDTRAASPNDEQQHLFATLPYAVDMPAVTKTVTPLLARMLEADAAQAMHSNALTHPTQWARFASLQHTLTTAGADLGYLWWSLPTATTSHATQAALQPVYERTATLSTISDARVHHTEVPVHQHVRAQRGFAQLRDAETVHGDVVQIGRDLIAGQGDDTVVDGASPAAAAAAAALRASAAMGAMGAMGASAGMMPRSEVTVRGMGVDLLAQQLQQPTSTRKTTETGVSGNSGSIDFSPAPLAAPPLPPLHSTTTAASTAASLDSVPLPSLPVSTSPTLPTALLSLLSADRAQAVKHGRVMALHALTAILIGDGATALLRGGNTTASTPVAIVPSTCTSASAYISLPRADAHEHHLCLVYNRALNTLHTTNVYNTDTHTEADSPFAAVHLSFPSIDTRDTFITALLSQYLQWAPHSHKHHFPSDALTQHAAIASRMQTTCSGATTGAAITTSVTSAAAAAASSLVVTLPPVWDTIAPLAHVLSPSPALTLSHDLLARVTTPQSAPSSPPQSPSAPSSATAVALAPPSVHQPLLTAVQQHLHDLRATRTDNNTASLCARLLRRYHAWTMQSPPLSYSHTATSTTSSTATTREHARKPPSLSRMLRALSPATQAMFRALAAMHAHTITTNDIAGGAAADIAADFPAAVAAAAAAPWPVTVQCAHAHPPAHAAPSTQGTTVDMPTSSAPHFPLLGTTPAVLPAPVLTSLYPPSTSCSSFSTASTFTSATASISGSSASTLTSALAPFAFSTAWHKRSLSQAARAYTHRLLHYPYLLAHFTSHIHFPSPLALPASSACVPLPSALTQPRRLADPDALLTYADMPSPSITKAHVRAALTVASVLSPVHIARAHGTHIRLHDSTTARAARLPAGILTVQPSLLDDVARITLSNTTRASTSQYVLVYYLRERTPASCDGLDSMPAHTTAALGADSDIPTNSGNGGTECTLSSADAVDAGADKDGVDGVQDDIADNDSDDALVRAYGELVPPTRSTLPRRTRGQYRDQGNSGDAGANERGRDAMWLSDGWQYRLLGHSEVITVTHEVHNTCPAHIVINTPNTALVATTPSTPPILVSAGGVHRRAYVLDGSLDVWHDPTRDTQLVVAVHDLALHQPLARKNKRASAGNASVPQLEDKTEATAASITLSPYTHLWDALFPLSALAAHAVTQGVAASRLPRNAMASVRKAVLRRCVPPEHTGEPNAVTQAVKSGKGIRMSTPDTVTQYFYGDAQAASLEEELWRGYGTAMPRKIGTKGNATSMNSHSAVKPKQGSEHGNQENIGPAGILPVPGDVLAAHVTAPLVVPALRRVQLLLCDARDKRTAAAQAVAEDRDDGDAAADETEHTEVSTTSATTSAPAPASLLRSLAKLLHRTIGVQLTSQRLPTQSATAAVPEARVVNGGITDDDTGAPTRDVTDVAAAAGDVTGVGSSLSRRTSRQRLRLFLRRLLSTSLPALAATRDNAACNSVHGYVDRSMLSKVFSYNLPSIARALTTDGAPVSTTNAPTSECATPSTTSMTTQSASSSPSSVVFASNMLPPPSAGPHMLLRVAFTVADPLACAAKHAICALYSGGDAHATTRTTAPAAVGNGDISTAATSASRTGVAVRDRTQPPSERNTVIAALAVGTKTCRAAQHTTPAPDNARTHTASTVPPASTGSGRVSLPGALPFPVFAREDTDNITTFTATSGSTATSTSTSNLTGTITTFAVKLSGPLLPSLPTSPHDAFLGLLVEPSTHTPAAPRVYLRTHSVATVASTDSNAILPATNAPETAFGDEGDRITEGWTGVMGQNLTEFMSSVHRKYPYLCNYALDSTTFTLPKSALDANGGMCVYCGLQLCSTCGVCACSIPGLPTAKTMQELCAGMSVVKYAYMSGKASSRLVRYDAELEGLVWEQESKKERKEREARVDMARKEEKKRRRAARIAAQRAEGGVVYGVDLSTANTDAGEDSGNDSEEEDVIVTPNYSCACLAIASRLSKPRERVIGEDGSLSLRPISSHDVNAQPPNAKKSWLQRLRHAVRGGGGVLPMSRIGGCIRGMHTFTFKHGKVDGLVHPSMCISVVQQQLHKHVADAYGILTKNREKQSKKEQNRTVVSQDENSQDECSLEVSASYDTCPDCTALNSTDTRTRPLSTFSLHKYHNDSLKEARKRAEREKKYRRKRGIRVFNAEGEEMEEDVDVFDGHVSAPTILLIEDDEENIDCDVVGDISTAEDAVERGNDGNGVKNARNAPAASRRVRFAPRIAQFSDEERDLSYLNGLQAMSVDLEDRDTWRRCARHSQGIPSELVGIDALLATTARSSSFLRTSTLVRWGERNVVFDLSELLRAALAAPAAEEDRSLDLSFHHARDADLFMQRLNVVVERWRWEQWYDHVLWQRRHGHTAATSADNGSGHAMCEDEDADAGLWKRRSTLCDDDRGTSPEVLLHTGTPRGQQSAKRGKSCKGADAVGDGIELVPLSSAMGMTAAQPHGDVSIPIDDVTDDEAANVIAEAHQYVGESLVVDEAEVDWLPEDEDEAYGPIRFTHRFSAWGNSAEVESAGVAPNALEEAVLEESEYEYEEDGVSGDEQGHDEDEDAPDVREEISIVGIAPQLLPDSSASAAHPLHSSPVHSSSSPHGHRHASPSFSLSVSLDPSSIEADSDDDVATSPRAHTRASFIGGIPPTSTRSTPSNLPASPHFRRTRKHSGDAESQNPSENVAPSVLATPQAAEVQAGIDTENNRVEHRSVGKDTDDEFDLSVSLSYSG